jgi:glycosyltransferase involved in cell wall biosynthesis
MPHKLFSYKLELFARKFILRYFDLIINLAKNASLERLMITGVKPVREVLAIHGHYEDRYISVNVINRETLGIPQESIVIFLHSNLKDYKGDIDFIDDFRENATQKLLLVVTGEIRKQEPSHPKIIFLPGYKSEEEMADLITLSDYFALPYKRITTSGAYMLAVTFKKPMITTDLPFFREHSLKDTALFYRIGDDSLRHIFEKIEKGWVPNNDNLQEMKNLYTWSNAAAKIKEAVVKMIKTGN